LWTANNKLGVETWEYVYEVWKICMGFAVKVENGRYAWVLLLKLRNQTESLSWLTVIIIMV